MVLTLSALSVVSLLLATFLLWCMGQQGLDIGLPQAISIISLVLTIVLLIFVIWCLIWE